MQDAATAIDGRKTEYADSWALPSDGGRWGVPVVNPRERVLSALADALAEMFPATRRLLGDWDFAALLKDYLRDRYASPCTHDALATPFPLFLAMHAPAAARSWATDLARLELALRQVRIEPSIPALPVARLRRLSAGQLASARLSLHPSWRMVSSSYPVLATWRALASMRPCSRPIVGDGTNVLLGPEGDGRVLLYELRPAELVFLRWLRAGRTVAEAAEAAGVAGPSFEAGTTVIQLAGLGVFAAPAQPPTLEAGLAA